MSAQESDAPSMPSGRPHTGRARNEQVRQAILASTVALLAEPGKGGITIEAVARQAKVGKQTIYRWWPTKSALLIEAFTGEARNSVPDIDTGDVACDLEHFLMRTFNAVRTPVVSGALRALIAGALADEDSAEVLRGYAAERRDALTAILTRARQRREIAADADLRLAAEQTMGYIWYRLILADTPLIDFTSDALAAALLRQLGHR
ncbi:TetR/AcrR family transcriptional regulator (plasmid) [Mycolicibacterium psychrotolerans]|uniref:TetR/AcrR family transcriptional regulator n=1 Tax=Mycolicibacterium psychrotolerans TaxID=216929 RepID=UPI003D67FAE9